MCNQSLRISFSLIRHSEFPSFSLQVAGIPFRLNRQCWYCANRASGMKRIRSSGQPVSAATAKTWAATKPGSSQAGAFFRPVPTRDRPVPPPARGSAPPGAGRRSGNPPESARRRRSGRLPLIPSFYDGAGRVPPQISRSRNDPSGSSCLEPSQETRNS